MSATLNLSDGEVTTLYDLLVESENELPDGKYKNDVESMREKLQGQL